MRAPRGLGGLARPALEVLARLLAEAMRASRAGARRRRRRRSPTQSRSCEGPWTKRPARIRSELAELRMLRLVEISAALSRSATRADVAAVVLTQAVEALYADTGFVAILEGDALDVEVLPGFPGSTGSGSGKSP